MVPSPIEFYTKCTLCAKSTSRESVKLSVTNENLNEPQWCRLSTVGIIFAMFEVSLFLLARPGEPQ